MTPRELFGLDLEGEWAVYGYDARGGKLVKYVPERILRHDAGEICDAYGARLPTIRTAEESAFLHSIVEAGKVWLVSW